MDRGLQSRPCKSCHSVDRRAYPSEINIHPPDVLENLDKPTVFAFPLLLVCLNCGLTEFVLAASEKRELLDNEANRWNSAGG